MPLVCGLVVNLPSVVTDLFSQCPLPSNWPDFHDDHLGLTLVPRDGWPKHLQQSPVPSTKHKKDVVWWIDSHLLGKFLIRGIWKL